MSVDFNRLEQVLADASALTGAVQRAAFLDEACGQDQELRAEVERLLAASEKVEDFLEEPVPLAAAAIENDRSAADPAGGIEGPGSIIGRYRLLEEIGEGGFGVVYMAEQTEPVQRKVALKVVKAGMDTREVVARFEAERQALALMDHPGIARVFDGGITQGGRPYFVMELVQGIPITKFCDQRNLSTRERLHLFIQVCHAVQHAHQKGIIHRDLKPTNILVTLIDGEPVPKVIDFGVAKALGQRLTEKTLFTAFLKMIGTPAYMSPEQADLSGVDIDTRADIYALGVLLYELLTGVTPLDGETLREAALDEIRRMIRETEPPMPSTRLRALGEQATEVAKRHQTEPAALNRVVRGDLDWIVMKCLEKDRRRRYETANLLAGDIERYLAHKPVLACPPSTAYLVGKFARRNKVALGTAALVGVAVVLGSVISVFQAIRATKAERLAAKRLEAEIHARLLAENARSQALTEASKATAVSEMLQKALNSTHLDASKGASYTMRPLLDDFSASLGDQLKQEPEVEASVRAAVGNAYRRLGAVDKAQPHLEVALALRRRVFGKDHENVAQSLLDLGWNYHERREDSMAEALTREALAIFEQRELTPQAVQASAFLELLLKCLGRFQEAEQVAREALLLAGTMDGPQVSARSGWLKPASANSAGWLDLARLCLDLEEQASTNGSIPEIQMLFTEAARLGGVAEPSSLAFLEWQRRGTSHLNAGRWAAALAAFSKAIQLHQHNRGLYIDRSRCHFQLAQFQEAFEDCTRALNLDPQNSGTWALRGLASLKLGRAGQAMADYANAIDWWTVRIERVGRGEPPALGRPYLWSLARSSELVRAGADPTKVGALYQRLESAYRGEVAALKKGFGPTHRETEAALTEFAQFLQGQGRHAEAEAVRREALSPGKADLQR